MLYPHTNSLRIPRSERVRGTHMNEQQSAGSGASSDIDADDVDRYVIVDQEGTVFYEDNDKLIGWDNEYEARYAARGVESREGGRWQVVRADEIEG